MTREGLKLDVLYVLAEQAEWLRTSTVATLLGVEWSTARDALDQLSGDGLVDYSYWLWRARP